MNSGFCMRIRGSPACMRPAAAWRSHPGAWLWSHCPQARPARPAGTGRKPATGGALPGSTSRLLRRPAPPAQTGPCARRRAPVSAATRAAWLSASNLSRERRASGGQAALAKSATGLTSPSKSCPTPDPSVPLRTAPRTWSRRSAPRRDQRIGWDLLLRRLTRTLAVPSVMEVPTRRPARWRSASLTNQALWLDK
jgi:hypothetical protein